jgi:hypothetical protein
MTSKHPYSYMNDRAINHLLLCCICEKPFVDPVTANDSRRGCRQCLSPYSDTLTPIQEWIVLEMLNGLLVECLQCGEENIRRGDLKQHEQTKCKQALVSCRAADIKCPWKGARAQLDKHMEGCVFEPLRPALSEIINDNKQFQDQIHKLETLVNELKEKR